MRDLGGEGAKNMLMVRSCSSAEQEERVKLHHLSTWDCFSTQWFCLFRERKRLKEEKWRMIINYLVKVNIGVCMHKGAFPRGAAVPQTGNQKQTEPFSVSKRLFQDQTTPAQAFHVHGLSKLGASHPSHSAAHPQPFQGSAQQGLHQQ